MKPEERERGKELYKQLRGLPWSELWGGEVARFNASSPEERARNVAVIRAVGVVFAESGDQDDKAKVQEWLRDLLQDPCEKTRRYAMAAIPKIGAGAEEETKLLNALHATKTEREKNYLGRTLGKIGGAAALDQGLPASIEQKIKASVGRRDRPSALRTDAVIADVSELRINLRGRDGLERIVREEVEESHRGRGKFRVAEVRGGCVTIIPAAPFSLGDIYAMRCFGTVGFVVGHAGGASEAESIEALATAIASPISRRLLRSLTEGLIRYRLNFVSRGHQRAMVARVAGRVYTLCPEILNDARSVTWTIDIYPDGRGHLVELRPNMTPDPRFSYRQRDVPAASHPPLAACLARIAGRAGDDVVWDPFCGSGSELIERVKAGDVRSVLGSDQSAEAIGIAQANFAGAKTGTIPAKFICGDFREIAASRDLGHEAVTLIITNPPMGMRVPVADLRELIQDLISVAAQVLKPGGRLVLVNPLPNELRNPVMALQYRQKVDLGGFAGRIEKYVKVKH